MGSPTVDIAWPSFDKQTEEENSDFLDHTKPSVNGNPNIPEAPPLPLPPRRILNSRLVKCCFVPKETKDVWDRLFKEGYGADVHIVSGDGFIIEAHHCVLIVASQVLGNVLQQSKVKNGIRFINIHGVPCDALRAFICFLYLSCIEEEEMKKCVLVKQRIFRQNKP